MRAFRSLYFAVCVLVLSTGVGLYVDLKNHALQERHLAISTGLECMLRLNHQLNSMVILSVLEQNTLRTASHDISAANRDLEEKVRLRTSELEEANRKLDLASRTDALTGLANRREFNDRLIAASTLPSTESLSLALIDVDHFKGYNDRYGHLAGDDCLQQIAAALQAALPAPDYLVARFGGEEFAVLAPGLAPTQVCHALRRAMDAVEGLAMPHASSAAAAVVTISIGLADAPGGSPIEALISAADRALYRAKHLGRNRLELAQPSHP